MNQLLRNSIDFQACLDQYEMLQTVPQAGSADDNPLSSAPAKVQECARQSLGDDAFEALNNGQRSPTKRETRQINACIRQALREARLEHPGIGGDLMVILHDFSPAQWGELIRFRCPPLTCSARPNPGWKMPSPT